MNEYHANRRRSAAYRQALARLRELHRSEFDRLYAEEIEDHR